MTTPEPILDAPTEPAPKSVDISIMLDELHAQIAKANERFDHVVEEARKWKQTAAELAAQIESMQTTIAEQRKELADVKAENVTLRQRQAQPIAIEANVMEHDLMVYRLTPESERMATKIDIGRRQGQRWRIAYENVTEGLQYVIRWERPLLEKQEPVPKLDPTKFAADIFKPANPQEIEDVQRSTTAAFKEGAA